MMNRTKQEINGAPAAVPDPAADVNPVDTRLLLTPQQQAFFARCRRLARELEMQAVGALQLIADERGLQNISLSEDGTRLVVMPPPPPPA